MNHYLDKILTKKKVQTKYIIFVHLSDLIEKVIKSKNLKSYQYKIQCKLYLIDNEIYVTYIDCIRNIINNSNLKTCKFLCKKINDEFKRIHIINNIKYDEYNVSKSWAIEKVELECLLENLCISEKLINQKKVNVINPKVDEFYNIGMAIDINNFNFKRMMHAKI
jgi:hypothetical protein